MDAVVLALSGTITGYAGVKVVVACECSGTVRDAFIALGHDAISCDIKPTENPGPHYTGDARDFLLKNGCDLLIAHPPCTYLARVSAPWLAKDDSRRAKMEEAVDLFQFFLTFTAEFVCVENPYPLAQARLPRWSQVIEPYHFGHAYTKATCLWLRGLPPLQPTEVRSEVHIKTERTIRPNGRINDSPHSWVRLMKNAPERAAIRAQTFPGIAAAMAAQWGNLKRPYGFFV